MRAIGWASGLLLSLSCVGPAAPDAEVCRDAVQRLCAAPRCAEVPTTGDDCEVKALERTGCGDDAFGFESPTRDRFLECRLILLRSGADRPRCDDVAEMFDRCPDVKAFLFGSGT